MAAKRTLIFAGAAATALADQGSKALVREHIFIGEEIPLAPFFNLTHHYNKGAIFGSFASGGGESGLLLIFGVVVILILAYLILARSSGWSGLALASILGGAVGNVIDRARFGGVLDWLDFHAAGWHWPAFNLADAALMLGVGAMLLRELRVGGSSPKPT